MRESVVKCRRLSCENSLGKPALGSFGVLCEPRGAPYERSLHVWSKEAEDNPVQADYNIAPKK